MNILSEMPSSLIYLSSVISLLVLLLASKQAPWRELSRASNRHHLWFFCIIFLSAFWLLKVRVAGVFALHPLGIASLTLIFGWSLAIIGGAVALLLLWHLMSAVLSLNGGLTWANFFTDHLLSVIVPASVSYLIMLKVSRLSYKNIFYYIFGVGFFGVGFFGSALGILIMGGVTLLMFYGFAGQQWPLVYQNAIYIAFLALPEAAINGMLMAIFVVMAPQMVKTYDDRMYLDNVDSK